ncbi:MAG: alanine racemase [Clostridiales bacterium]|nr:alanine racemase [Clostridiales bacterium]
MNDFFKRSWVLVNLDALKYNFETIRERVEPSSKIMAIVKADAYGHGYERVVNELRDDGCDWFGVSNLEEALQVRAVCADKPILILGYTPPKYASRLALNNISQTVFNLSYAHRLSEYAVEEGVQVSVHIKIDTGMSRLGFQYQDSERDIDSVDEVAEVCALPNLYHEGIFTHFASADETKVSGEVFTRLQFDLFLNIIEKLRLRGITFDYRHCCNSAATLIYPEMHLDMVRTGIITFGLYPSDDLKDRIKLLPVMEFKTVISMIKTIRAGTPVSYGSKFTAEKDMRIATVPVGYADGYPRSLSGSDMLYKGKRVPIIGNICMDQCMLDVSGIENASEGKTVTVFGRSGDDEITIDSLAEKLGTINYELICGISKRVPRIYTRNDEIESITDYISSMQ